MNLDQIKKKYQEGQNITRLLAGVGGLNSKRSIEIAYDLQSGSYSDLVKNNIGQWKDYGKQLSEIISFHSLDGDSILDAGTGEMTTLSAIMLFLKRKVNYYAFDLSLSRVLAGKKFLHYVEENYQIESPVCTFVSEMSSIPFSCQGFDIVFTSHALEPNHGRERELIKELLRVTNKKLILFEPCYEENSKEGQARMDDLGYVRGLDSHIIELGAEIIDKVKIENPSNHLNPTYAWVIRPNQSTSGSDSNKNKTIDFTCPISGFNLKKYDTYLWSSEGMYSYPIIAGVPVIKPELAIILSKNFDK